MSIYIQFRSTPFQFTNKKKVTRKKIKIKTDPFLYTRIGWRCYQCACSYSYIGNVIACMSLRAKLWFMIGSLVFAWLIWWYFLNGANHCQKS